MSREGAFSNVSFSLGAGEIVGMAGLVGSGRSEIAQACFGLPRRRAAGSRLMASRSSRAIPKQMLGLGLAYLPEDRDGLGLIMSSSIVGNVTLPVLDRLARLGFVGEAGSVALRRKQ